MAFHAEVQAGPNGPWTPAFRKRVEKVRDQLGASLQELGQAFGFSGSFVHGLMNGKAGYNMSSKHAERVLRALEVLEVKAGFRNAAPPPNAHAAEAADAGAQSDLAALIRQIYDLGFTVELKPRSV